MDLGLILGLILVLGSYTGLLVYYDNSLRLKFPPLLVGLKGRVFPLEELIIGKKIKGYVDPLELESIFSRRDRALGFTSYFMTIVSILGSTAIISLIFAGENILIIIPLTLLLYLHLYLYKWSKNIEVNYWLEKRGESYVIGIAVKASPRSKIWVVNEPPLGEVYGATRVFGEGYVRLEYYWKPVVAEEVSWKPQLVIVEEANGLLRLDFSKRITYNIVPSARIEAMETGREAGRGFEGTGAGFGTIREPEVIGVREYIIGDRLKDIIAKTILKPGGPRVRKYKELIEGSTTSKEPVGSRVVFVLGELTRSSKNYRDKIIHLVNEVLNTLSQQVLIIWERQGKLYRISRDLLNKDLEGSELVEYNGVLKGDADTVFIDPSVTIDVYGRKKVIILPIDWRVEVFESYQHAWEKYLGEIEDVFGVIEKI